MADDGFAAFMSFVGDGSAAASSHNDKPADSTPVKSKQQGHEKPNEDEYSYEEEQEREAMMRNYHHPMKKWFRQNPSLTVIRALYLCSICSVPTTNSNDTAGCYIVCILLITGEARPVPALLARSQDVGAVPRSAEGVHPSHRHWQEQCEWREHRVGSGLATAAAAATSGERSNSRVNGCGRRAEPRQAASEESMGCRSGPVC